MASHYISLNRGEGGFSDSDFSYGAASTAGDVIELRVLDGAGTTKMDVIKALMAFERFFNNPQEVKAAAFDVSG